MTTTDIESTAEPPVAATPVTLPRVERFLRTRKAWVVIYLAFLAAYAAASGNRIRQHSPYNHFVYLADGWLKGRLDLAVPPPNENDWGRVEVLTLRDGREVRGQFSQTGASDRFLPLRGRPITVTPDMIAGRRWIRYVSFPPFPAVLMLPFVAVWGLAFNDVLFTVLWAALNPLLLFLLLERLRVRGDSTRSSRENLWLTVAFGVGSVYYFASVLGQVWYTAHAVAVTLIIGYAAASLDARWPTIAGLCVGLGFATRPPLGYMLPLFLWQSVVVAGGWAALRSHAAARRVLLGKLVRFAIPAGLILAVLLWHNWARFGSPTEFGHKFLNIVWQERIQRWGLFNYHFLSRNLAAAFVLLPRILVRYPYVRVGYNGLSIFFTSSFIAYVFFRARRTPLDRPLWLTIGAAALPSLLYQSTGFVQFGYRYSLDYMVYVMMLLALGGRPIGRLWKALIVVSIVINLFGAVTFDRYYQFTYDDSFFPNGRE